MILAIWQHLECPEGTPQDNSFDEVVCAGCMKKHDFLWRYAPKYSVSKSCTKDDKSVVTKENEDVVDVTTVSSDECSLPPSIGEQTNSGSCFWLEGWRSSLCRCSDCTKIYEDARVSFLLDPLDSVQAYEEAGKSNPRETQYEKGMRALASLDHVRQIDAIQGSFINTNNYFPILFISLSINETQTSQSLEPNPKKSSNLDKIHQRIIFPRKLLKKFALQKSWPITISAWEHTI